MSEADQARKLAWAKAYPFANPGHSYLYVNGETRPLVDEEVDEDGAMFRGRWAVLASGSNQSPEQLSRKYGNGANGGGDDVVIPMTLASLYDFDSVYSAHITSYGSIPSTPHPSPGTVVNLFINWLTAAQLHRMHETEQPGENYHFGRLKDARVTLTGGRRLAEVYGYVSVHGCLVRDGQPLGLGAVAATNRRYAALGQVEAIAHARDHAAPGKAVDDFILDAVAQPDLRRRHITALHAQARPASFPGFEKIEV